VFILRTEFVVVCLHAPDVYNRRGARAILTKHKVSLCYCLLLEQYQYILGLYFKMATLQIKLLRKMYLLFTVV